MSLNSCCLVGPPLKVEIPSPNFVHHTGSIVSRFKFDQTLCRWPIASWENVCAEVREKKEGLKAAFERRGDVVKLLSDASSGSGAGSRTPASLPGTSTLTPAAMRTWPTMPCPRRWERCEWSSSSLQQELIQIVMFESWWRFWRVTSCTVWQLENHSSKPGHWTWSTLLPSWCLL